LLSVHCGWEWNQGDPLVLETVGHSVNGLRQDIPLTQKERVARIGIPLHEGIGNILAVPKRRWATRRPPTMKGSQGEQQSKQLALKRYVSCRNVRSENSPHSLASSGHKNTDRG
jgi:hypothetical protein